MSEHTEGFAAGVWTRVTLRRIPRLSHQQDYARIEAERSERRARDKARALEFLMSVLTAEQREQYASTRSITLRGSHGGTYTLYSGSYQGNIAECTPDGKIRRMWCAHPPLYDETADMNLAVEWALAVQLLALTHNEAAAMHAALPH